MYFFVNSYAYSGFYSSSGLKGAWILSALFNIVSTASTVTGTWLVLIKCLLNKPSYEKVETVATGGKKAEIENLLKDKGKLRSSFKK